MPYRLVDFSRQTGEFAAQFNEIGQKHGVFSAIEMLEGLLIFPRLAREFADRFKKIGQKDWGFASIEMLDAFRYGKINKPLTRSATEKQTRPCQIASACQIACGSQFTQQDWTSAREFNGGRE